MQPLVLASAAGVLATSGALAGIVPLLPAQDAASLSLFDPTPPATRAIRPALQSPASALTIQDPEAQERSAALDQSLRWILVLPEQSLVLREQLSPRQIAGLSGPLGVFWPRLPLQGSREVRDIGRIASTPIVRPPRIDRPFDGRAESVSEPRQRPDGEQATEDKAPSRPDQPESDASSALPFVLAGGAFVAVAAGVASFGRRR